MSEMVVDASSSMEETHAAVAAEDDADRQRGSEALPDAPATHHSAVGQLEALPELKTTILASNGQLLVEESEQLLRTSVAAMKANLSDEPAWSGAPPPTDEFLLMFLRAEVFSPTKAAARYRKFWEVKVSLWGEEKAALPITATDAMVGLKTQVMQFVPGSRDVEGRQVIFIDTANSDKSVPREERIKAVWYILLTALADVETQRRGFCFVVTFKNAQLSQVDHKYNKMTLDSMQGALPVRVGSHNICHPPPFFRIFWTVLSTFMSKRVKQRIRFVVGTDAKIVKKLDVIIAAENVPSPIGPKSYDFTAWLAERVQSGC